MATITKELVNGLMETVRNLYLADDIPWVIGYSGGKDSTATLQLVWLAIQALPSENRKKTIHIINTDTLVESHSSPLKKCGGLPRSKDYRLYRIA